MEGNVVVFDRANQRIGFAPSNMSHPDVGPCGKKSPRGPGNSFFEACVLLSQIRYDTNKLSKRK